MIEKAFTEKKISGNYTSISRNAESLLKAKKSASRVSPNMARVGGVCSCINQSASRLLKITSPQF